MGKFNGQFVVSSKYKGTSHFATASITFLSWVLKACTLIERIQQGLMIFKQAGVEGVGNWWTGVIHALT